MDRPATLKDDSAYQIKHRYHSQGTAAGGSALLDAITRGKVHLARFILEAASSNVVNTRDFKGKTSLIRACYIKEEATRAKAIEVLLHKGADINIQDEHGRTALSYACELRCNDVITILVQHNVDPDLADIAGNTALIYAANAGNDAAIGILLRSFRRLGLNVDHVNNEGLTALLVAAKHGFIECASLLALEGRACISFRDREKGMNAEEWARAQGCCTPEVTSFSPQASLLRVSRADSVEQRTSCATSSKDVTVDTTSLISTSSASSTSSQHSEARSSVSKSSLAKCIADTDASGGATCSPQEPSTRDSGAARVRAKRGSLPSIKLAGFFTKPMGSISDQREEPFVAIGRPKSSRELLEIITARDRLSAETKDKPLEERFANRRMTMLNPETELLKLDDRSRRASASTEAVVQMTSGLKLDSPKRKKPAKEYEGCSSPK